jgi:hypothetical protein
MTATTTPTAALVTAGPVLGDPEPLALAGFLAGYISGTVRGVVMVSA